MTSTERLREALERRLPLKRTTTVDGGPMIIDATGAQIAGPIWLPEFLDYIVETVNRAALAEPTRDSRCDGTGLLEPRLDFPGQQLSAYRAKCPGCSACNRSEPDWKSGLEVLATLWEREATTDGDRLPERDMAFAAAGARRFCAEELREYMRGAK